jgi:hypothetical protein
VKIETFAESSDRPPTSLIEPLALSDHLFKPVGQEAAHGASLLGRQDPSLAQEISIKLNGDVRFHNGSPRREARIYVQHHYRCWPALLATGDELWASFACFRQAVHRRFRQVYCEEWRGCSSRIVCMPIVLRIGWCVGLTVPGHARRKTKRLIPAAAMSSIKLRPIG